ncbi:hypothetical protein [Pygmaiobacter massiliensis]|uniref:hypothetical protein n=1 Tax=Pygmaiobacter massiliensis TaxID=1917873 RepID=UPI0028A23DED|nr:hypothetical protein [Pygmaiobacter massiliensis]
MTKKKLITAVACSALVLSIGAVSAFAATGNLGNAEAKGGSVAFDGSVIEDDSEVMVTDTLPEGVGEMIGQGTVMLKEEDGKLYSSSDDGATWSENLEETIGFKDGIEYTSGSFDNNGNAVPDDSEVIITDSLPEGGEMIGQGRVDLKQENGKLYSSIDGGKIWSENNSFEVPAK